MTTPALIQTPILSVPDPRDFLYVPLPGNLPLDGDLLSYEEVIDDQQQEGSCTSFGIEGQCEMLSFRAGKNIKYSKQFLYYNERDVLNMLSQEGADVRTGLHCASSLGICLDSTWPYLAGNENTQPPANAYTEALNYKIDRYERIYNAIADGDPLTNFGKITTGITSAITEGCGVVLTMALGQQFQSITGSLLTQQYNVVSPTNPLIGYHCMGVRGYRNSAMPYGFIVRNSWGTGWGDNGYALLPWGCTANIQEVWVIRGFAGYDIIPTPGVVCTECSEFNLTARIVPPTPNTVANVWVGAKVGNELLIKQPDNSWQPYTGGAYTPNSTKVALNPWYDLNIIAATDNVNLNNYSGAQVYVAYGNDPMTWTLTNICTIGTGLTNPVEG